MMAMVVKENASQTVDSMITVKEGKQKLSALALRRTTIIFQASNTGRK